MKFLLLIALVFHSLPFLAQNSDSDNQLLWEISGNGLKKKSYLFGSFHTNDKRVFKLGDSTYFALNNVESIILESDLTELFDEFDTREEEVKVLFDSKGKPYSGTKKASKTMYGDEDGMPQFLDAYFQQYSQNSGKSFYPLESIEDQMNLLNEKTSFESGFETNFNELEARVVSQEQILKMYLLGDIYGLDRLMRTSLGVYPGLYNGLILDRNEIMSTGIDTLIMKQSAFIAVGAGHLAGDAGIINLLRKKGYRLRKVGFCISESSTPDKKSVQSLRSYVYLNEEHKLRAVFPGKPNLVNESSDGFKLVYREFGQGNTYIVEFFKKAEGNLESFAEEFIQSPRTSKVSFELMDDGTWISEGISDTYPEGISWVRILEGADGMVVIKTYGGNKFMNSNRPKSFFNNVWLEYEN